MKCFTHQSQDAVGQCKSCGKGFCRSCLVEVSKRVYCKACAAEGNFSSRQGSDSTTESSPSKPEGVSPSMPYSKKDPLIAALLAFVGGIFALPGLGHIYVGRLGRGIVIFVGYWIFLIIGIFTLCPLIGVFLIFVWQIIDAHGLAKKYNEEFERTGRAPW